MNDTLDWNAVVRFEAESNRRSDIYLLLDAAGLPDLRSQLASRRLDFISLFHGTKEANIAAAPILIAIARQGQTFGASIFLQWLNEAGCYTSSVNVLVSDLSLEELCAKLQPLLDVRLPGGLEALFRIYDPRVFEAAVQVLSTDQLSLLMQPVRKWIYVNRAGRFVSYLHEALAAPPYSPPLELDQAQETALIEGAELDRVLQILREETPALLETIPKCDQAERVECLMASARALGIDAQPKLTVFISAALSCSGCTADGTHLRETAEAVHQLAIFQ